ncbi:MAG: DUF4440 domain-containing protein [Colwellia sp.]
MSSQGIIENMDGWVSSFSEDTSRSICRLYDEKASLWGTLSPIKRDSAALIEDYFDQVFKYQNRNVKLNSSNIRVFGEVAISNGLYTFTWFKDSAKITTLARFSFVYIKKGDRWYIIEHHSSIAPKAG